ncbi:MAG: hypothetical protein LBB30_04370 [Candidatus Methanoplasma sp.]|nr:hypothetical protein [Candidatus Methanoplasma sp.]
MSNKIIQKDRSGIATVLLVIIIVAVLVVAAGAAYVVMSGDDDKEEPEEEKQTLAPGTVMKYDITGIAETPIEGEVTYIGQSAELYFVMLKIPISETMYSVQYDILPKKVPKDAKVSTVEIDFEGGKKKVTLWEYSTPYLLGENAQSKTYIDPSIGLMYKDETTVLGMTIVQVLKEYTPQWQESFEESESIGMTSEYAANYMGQIFNLDIVCIAGCGDDQFGVMIDFSKVGSPRAYFLSDHPQGLPVDAKYTGNEYTLDTIDGEGKSVQVWNILDENENGYVFYYDPVSHNVYRMVLISGATIVIFDLTKKPA